MVNRSHSIGYTILIVFFLFVPNTIFEIYYLLCGTVLAVILLKNRSISKSSFILFLFFTIPFLIRFLVFGGVEELKEYVKLIWIFLLFNIPSHRARFLPHLLFAYVFIDFLISLTQFLHLSNPIVELIQTLYNAENHLRSLEYNSVRALGLSSGPGQHGVILFIMFLVVYYRRDVITGKLLKYLFFALTLLAILLSQSKTIFLSVILFISFEFVFRRDFTLFPFVFAVFLLVLTQLNNLIKLFREYGDIIQGAIFTSSFHARLDKWISFLEPMEESPLFLLFGPGRSFLTSIGTSAGAYDSDYIYLIVNYGLIGVIISFVIFGIIAYSTIKSNKYIFLMLLIPSLTLNVFFDIKAVATLIFLLNYRGK